MNHDSSLVLGLLNLSVHSGTFGSDLTRFTYPSETEADLVYDMGQDDGDGGGGGRRTILPLIDEWGEIVLNDGPELDLGESEYLHDNGRQHNMI